MTTDSHLKPLELIDTVLSGNGWKVRLLAGHLGIPLIRRSLSIVDGDLEEESFGEINPLRQVPVLKTRDGHWLSESSAILWYLGEGTEFVPSDPTERAQVIQWLMFEQTKLMWNLAQPRLWIALRKSMNVNDPRAIRWRQRGTQQLDILEHHLKGRNYVVGSSPTIADLALYPYIRMSPLGGYDLAPYPRLNDWLQKIRALPGHVPLIEGDNETA